MLGFSWICSFHFTCQFDTFLLMPLLIFCCMMLCSQSDKRNVISFSINLFFYVSLICMCFVWCMVCGAQVWMCGGQVEIATCSHVGHVFRKSTPYTFPGGTSKIVNHNNARLAEVWLDEWKEFYYSINPGQTHLQFTNL